MVILSQTEGVMTELSNGPLIIRGTKLEQMVPFRDPVVLARCQYQETARAVMEFIGKHAGKKTRLVIIGENTETGEPSAVTVVEK